MAGHTGETLQISVTQFRHAIRAYALIAPVLAGVVLLDGAPGAALPETFRRELLVIGVLAIAFVVLTLTGRSLYAYLATGWMILSVGVIRIAVGPGMPLLLLLLGAVAAAGTIESPAGRRSAEIFAIAVVIILPVPGQVFGVPSSDHSIVYIVAIGVTAVVLALTNETILGLFALVDAEHARNDRLESGMQNLAEVNVGFQEYSQTVEARSKHEERNRITRDIHDTVGYSLTNIAVMLDAAVGLIGWDVPRVRTMLHKGREQVDTAHAEVRRALHALRALASAEEFGVRNLLHIGDQFAEATDVSVDIDFGNAARSYGPHTDATLSRLVQEGLANAFRHGGATAVSVRLWQSDSQLTLTIRDNGRGSEVIEEGIGFLGMQERLSQIHGTLSWQSLSTGFVLIAEVVLSVPSQDGGA